MRLIACVIIAIWAALVTTSPTPPVSDEVDVLAHDALANLVSYEMSHGSSSKICTIQNTTVRRECKSVSLGSVGPSLQIPGLEPQSGNGLDYNPRCLRRDISSYVSTKWTKTSDVTGLIKNYQASAPSKIPCRAISQQATSVSMVEAITLLVVTPAVTSTSPPPSQHSTSTTP